MFNPDAPYDHKDHRNQTPLITPTEHRRSFPYAGIPDTTNAITETAQKVARRLEKQWTPIEPGDEDSVNGLSD